MELDDTICYCFHVTKRKILNFLRVERSKVPSQISQCGGAGTGCGWCRTFLKKYHAEFTAGQASQADTLSPQEYARGRGRYIRAGRGTPPPGAIPPPEEEG